jgi:aldose 1-epimerase
VPLPIGARIGPLLRQAAGGYDHSLVLDAGPAATGTPRRAARLREPVTGRVLELFTTEPALQVYTGQALPRLRGKHGADYMPFAGLALEPQGFPNAVNEPGFPFVVVEPGAPYRQRSVYRFSVE